jgi:peptidoglycan pentaglycine glycine transferase (the first glycine)
MERDLWNSTVSKLPNPHFLQTYEWGQVKSTYGWSPLYAVWDSESRFSIFTETDYHPLPAAHCTAAALLLKRQVLNKGFARHLSILYTPKGPLLDWSDEHLRNRVLNDLQSYAKKQGSLFFKMDPDVVRGTGIPGSEGEIIHQDGQKVIAELEHRGWRYSSEQIQFRNTVLIDLSPGEDEILASMKQKTRYNVRLAEKKGVSLRIGTQEDFPLLYRMYAETSVRDGFVIRDEGYYRTVWETFMQENVPAFQRSSASTFSPTCEPLIAEVDGEPVAAIFVFYFAGRAYYVYGMSRNIHREKMPTYLLQWEAMKRARSKGCSVYDLWGAPEVFNESDSMWGVYRFKEGLGGEVVRTLGAWDFAPSPIWYKLYSDVMPRLLNVMRSRGKARTKQKLGA